MIKKNQCITSLNLSQSRLPENSIKVLCEGLKVNTNLVDLFLDNIQLTDDDINELAENILLTKNHNIKTIDLSYNDISNDGFATIMDACSKNFKNCDIRVKGNSSISKEQKKSFEDLLLRNICIGGAICSIFDNTFTAINVAIRVKQTTALLGGRSRGSASPISGDDDNNPRSRTRTRGNTIDISTVPTHLLTASSADEIMEDCGDTPSLRYQVGVSHTRGRRKDMQDATLLKGNFNQHETEDLFCVFDGHGDQEPATYSAKNISSVFNEKLTLSDDKLSSADKDDDTGGDDSAVDDSDDEEYDNHIVTALCDSFIHLNQQMKHFVQCGTTAVVCYIKDHILYTANVGDSRAILYRKGKAIRLTVDHKPDLTGETERIEQMGGSIKNNRVQGTLAVTRALGDWFAGLLVSPEPYVTVTHLNSDDEFLLIACDGVFDVFSDDAACEKIKDISDPKQASQLLKAAAFDNGSTDNISVVVIRLGDNHKIDPLPEHEPIIARGLWEPEFSDEGSSSAVEVESEEDEDSE